jgi:Rieske Fe-S protein
LYETQDLQGRPVALLRSVASGSGSGSSGAAAASADGSAIMAFSTRCTHLGCQVRWQPTEQTFLCPCHMGVFDKTGKVISGPPPAPLAQYEVVVENDNVFLKFPEA